MKLIDRLDYDYSRHVLSVNTRKELVRLWNAYPELRDVVWIAQRIIDTDALDTHPLDLKDELIEILEALDVPDEP